MTKQENLCIQANVVSISCFEGHVREDVNCWIESMKLRLFLAKVLEIGFEACIRPPTAVYTR